MIIKDRGAGWGYRTCLAFRLLLAASAFSMAMSWLRSWLLAYMSVVRAGLFLTDRHRGRGQVGISDPVFITFSVEFGSGRSATGPPLLREG